MGATADPYLQVRDLRVRFATEDGVVRAVDGVSFAVERGRTLGIVGESGSGKSVTSLAILGLHDPKRTTITGGISVGGRQVVGLPDEEVRRLRGRDMAMIFQDPLSALHPYYTVGRQIAEAYRVHHPGAGRREARTRAVDMLGRVGIPQPARRFDQYPHEFSGGMRQRVMIAMALVNDPDLLIADEPTTALDVTVQAQILELLDRLRQKRGMAVLLISHDLGVVAGRADRVAVMYAGRIVEEAPTARLFAAPAHPYTRGLFASVPTLAGPRARLLPIPGTVPSAGAWPSGCRFRTRCPHVMPVCTDEPPIRIIAPSHTSRCWLDA